MVCTTGTAAVDCWLWLPHASQPLLERWGVTQGAKAHGIDLFVKKVKKMKPDEEVPPEIMGEVAFVRM